jgi:TonB family protein
LETRYVASASSASRSPATATPATASATAQPAAPAAAQAAADVTVITTRDDFLLELGQLLGGRAAVRPVESLEAALAGMAGARRAQVLVIDARELADVGAALEAKRAALARAVVLVFAPAEKRLGSTLKASRVFALLPLPIDARKTQAVLEGAIAAAAAARTAISATPAPPRIEPGISALRPVRTPQRQEPEETGRRRAPLLIGAALAATAVAGSAFWFFMRGHGAPANSAAPAVAAMSAPASAAAGRALSAPAADTSIVHGKVDELLEKARLAMHERRFSEPAANNALLYYRSAAAADASSAEARDGLQRVAAVLAGRFDEALSGGRFDEAALTLADLKLAVPGDARLAACEQRLLAAEISHALTGGNIDGATALVHQAQQSGAVPAEQLSRWRADVTRRQEEAKVQRLAGLIEDRIRDGKLIDSDDSARVYLQQLAAAAPADAATQRATYELENAYLHKAREAALARNSAEEERWLNEARAAGVKPAEIAAFQKELAGARQKATQVESDRLLQLSRERLRDGRLTDPPQDSAAGYLTQLQASDPANAGLGDAGRELAKALLERARAAMLAGKAGDTDLAQARRWGADPKDVAAVQQLQPAPAPGAPDAALLAGLKRLRAVPPEYPASALAQRITGVVTLEYTVDSRGEPRDIHVVEATPPQVFDQAAINAVKHWRYAPTIVNGAAVEVPGAKARMHFELPK